MKNQYSKFDDRESNERTSMSKRAGRVGAGTDAFTKRTREMDFRSASREPRFTPLKYTKVVDPNKVGNESGTARTIVLVSYGDGDFLVYPKVCSKMPV